MMIRILLFSWVASAVTGFSPSGRHFTTFSQDTTHGNACGHTSLNAPQTLMSLHSISPLSDTGLSEEAQSIFEQSAEGIGRKDPKATNLELASRGQAFSSFRRNFDYMKSGGGVRGGDSVPSIWKRDNLQNVNVEEILNACGLTEEEVQRGSMDGISQVYTLQMDGSNEWDIETIKGMDVLDLIKRNRNGGSNTDTNTNMRVEHRWVKGDTYVTEVFMEAMQEPFFRMDRWLDYTEKATGSVGDSLAMMVQSHLTLEGKETVSSTEVYYRTYGMDMDHDDDSYSRNVLSTTHQRVPGCIANVDIRTVLIPKEYNDGSELDSNAHHYQVVIDGMADAILSRGLVSLMQSTLSSLDVQDILSVEPSTITDRLGLRNVLTSGRNDGLASMLTIVQRQIKSLLDEDASIKLDGGLDEEVSREPNDNHKIKTKPTVAMLLSGGVDSSVALNLLVRQGYDVTAFYLKIWLEDELAHLGQCPWEDDYNVCTEICAQANVPLEAISLQEEYKEKVLSYTINEAKSGRTPNPDIMCNSRVKFGCFYDAISTRDFDYVATGHYAQLVEKNISEMETDEETAKATPVVKKLLRAPDPVKDQSYFLAALTQEQLNKVLFPIGHLEKSEVRDLAKEFDLPNKNRPDSQGLCFLGKVRFDDFLANYLGTDPGDIIDAETKEIIGRHNGIWFHTVGQRKGIGKVLFPKATSRGPWYVVAKDTTNKFIIASNQYDEEKFESTRREFCVEDIKWITDVPPTSDGSPAHLTMKIRHGPTIVKGTIELQGEGDVGKVFLDVKDGGLAPGQFVAFYDDVECLGSAVISEKHWLNFLESSSNQ